ncbi:hypothetical protein OG257_00605 [Streptomyces sp. NBC_00683]|uniref:hypothetical protein n=1 Tax=Streptomyces sp. NBC_00683 TaxID=2903670 RepID=UPI002E2F9859|nr:hypothetical protein [Streptomyces sp. NBC_00683]
MSQILKAPVIRHVLDPMLTVIAPFDVAAARLQEFVEQLGQRFANQPGSSAEDQNRFHPVLLRRARS